MKIVSDEVFGPVACIVPVKSDSEAVSLMNESPFGLTASLWTKDVGVADALARELEVGTVFLNRCDYLDPSLVWTGTKASGRGYALSDKGFEAFVRLKSLHFRLP